MRIGGSVSGCSPANDALNTAPAPAPPPTATAPPQHERMGNIPVLHGWRAVSILLVLASHWLPLPKVLALNHAAGAAGMALFFCLSGFLIASFLDAGEPLARFMVKRLARIVPLAWLAVSVLLLWHPQDLPTMARNFLLVANIPPAALLPGGEHLWSLCVEFQFYVLAALLCLLFGRGKGLAALPVLCVAVTLGRIVAHEPISIITWQRIDEILAGSTLALAYRGRFGDLRRLFRVPLWAGLLALYLSSAPFFPPIEYLRPYAAALLVGSTLYAAPGRLHRLLTTRPMLLVAEMSYAIYVIHGMLTATWLGTSPYKYPKRPLLAAATFILAWLSTRYFERPIMRWARRLPMGQGPASACPARPGD